MKQLILILALLLAVPLCHAQADAKKPLAFAWGASLTTSVDLTGHERSTIGMDAYFGVKSPMIQIIGIGTGLNIPISNSLHTLPIYLIARSNFRHKKSLCFADVRAGVSINDVSDSKKQTVSYGSLGIGINLASSAKFTSHLILAYSYFGSKSYTEADVLVKVPDLHMATLRLGITF